MRFPYFVIVLLLGLAVGCGQKDVAGPDSGPSSTEGPSTPDELVDSFARVFREKNHQEYAELLHPDFVFHFDEADWPAAAPSWDRARELESNRLMFTGEQDGDGIAIGSINLSLGAQGVWEDLGEAKQSRTFSVAMTVQQSNGTALQVQGTQDFTVIAEDGLFRLLEWVDHGLD